MSDIEQERIVAAHHKLGHSSRRRGDWIRTVVLMLVVAWIIFREFQLAGAVQDEDQSRETAVSLAAQVQAECDDPTIGVDLAICQQAEDIIEDPENGSIVTVTVPGEPGKPGRDASAAQVAAAVDDQLLQVLRPLIQPAVDEWFRTNPVPTSDLSQSEIEAAFAAWLAANPIPVPEDGADGRDGTDGRDGPACPNGATPQRFTYHGTANLGLPEGVYLICRAG
jgi:hypothetical protein